MFPSHFLSWCLRFFRCCHSPVSLLKIYWGRRVHALWHTSTRADSTKSTSLSEKNQGRFRRQNPERMKRLSGRTAVVAADFSPGLRISMEDPSCFPLLRCLRSSLSSSKRTSSKSLDMSSEIPRSICAAGPAQAQPPRAWIHNYT